MTSIPPGTMDKDVVKIAISRGSSDGDGAKYNDVSSTRPYSFSNHAYTYNLTTWCMGYSLPILRLMSGEKAISVCPCHHNVCEANPGTLNNMRRSKGMDLEPGKSKGNVGKRSAYRLAQPGIWETIFGTLCCGGSSTGCIQLLKLLMKIEKLSHYWWCCRIPGYGVQRCD